MSVMINPAIAGIDVGSNTVHLTVARPLDANDLEILADESDLVRLGHDVAAQGAISEPRARRALAALRRYRLLAEMLSAQVLCVATESVRGASNGALMLRRAREEAGVEVLTITGEQEGALGYWGATSGVSHITGQRMVIDMGGGSLQLTVGTGSRIAWRTSVPLGAGTVRDRYGLGNPPSLAQLDRAYHAVRETLREYQPPQPIEEVSVCGGTAGAIAALIQQLYGDDRHRVVPRNGHLVEVTGQRTITRHHLECLLAVLRDEPAEQLAARFSIKAARARILAAGVVSLLGSLEHVGVSRARISRRGIREGMILAWLQVGRGWLELASSGAGWAD